MSDFERDRVYGSGSVGKVVFDFDNAESALDEYKMHFNTFKAQIPEAVQNDGFSTLAAAGFDILVCKEFDAGVEQISSTVETMDQMARTYFANTQAIFNEEQEEMPEVDMPGEGLENGITPFNEGGPVPTNPNGEPEITETGGFDIGTINPNLPGVGSHNNNDYSENPDDLLEIIQTGKIDISSGSPLSDVELKEIQKMVEKKLAEKREIGDDTVIEGTSLNKIKGKVGIDNLSESEVYSLQKEMMTEPQIDPETYTHRYDGEENVHVYSAGEDGPSEPNKPYNPNENTHYSDNGPVPNSPIEDEKPIPNPPHSRRGSGGVSSTPNNTFTSEDEEIYPGYKMPGRGPVGVGGRSSLNYASGSESVASEDEEINSGYKMPGRGPVGGGGGKSSLNYASGSGSVASEDEEINSGYKMPGRGPVGGGSGKSSLNYASGSGPVASTEPIRVSSYKDFNEYNNKVTNGTIDPRPIVLTGDTSFEIPVGNGGRGYSSGSYGVGNASGGTGYSSGSYGVGNAGGGTGYSSGSYGVGNAGGGTVYSSGSYGVGNAGGATGYATTHNIPSSDYVSPNGDDDPIYFVRKNVSPDDREVFEGRKNNPYVGTD